MIKDGLPNNSVISIIQDSTGYIWAVTKYGLGRYDGRSFKVFKQENNNNKSLSSNDFLKNIILDKKGRLWVSSNQLDLYNPQTESFQQVPTGMEGIKTIFCDSRNRIWVGADNNLKYFDADNPGNIHTVSFSLDKDCQINTIYEDYQHHIWIGSTKGLFELSFSGKKIHSKKWEKDIQNQLLSSNDITTIAEDADQNLWIGTREHGINFYNRQTGQFHIINKNRSGQNTLVGNRIRKILLTNDGNLWIGTQDGLSILNPKDFTFFNLRHDPSNPHSLSHNSIYDIYQDKYGSIWIGAYFGGLNVVHMVKTRFTIFQNNNFRNSLSSNIISAIVKDSKDNLWIGTEAEGLNYLNKSTGQITSFKNDIYNSNSLSSNLVKAIAIDQHNKVYIGTATGGLNIYDPKTNQFETFQFSNQQVLAGKNADNVSCILITKQNQILIGGNDGLRLFVEEQKKMDQIDYSFSDKMSVTALYEDAKGTIWVGSQSGIFRLNATNQLEPANFVDEKNAPFHYEVNCLGEDNLSQLWVGTYHSGLALLDEKTGRYKIFTIEDGLPSNNILGIITDDQNNLWISTDNGLSKLDTKTQKFQNLTIEDGLPENQFNKGSYCKYAENEYFFGTYNGLVSFNPGEIAINSHPPKVVFSSIKLFNIPLDINQQQELLKGDLNYGKTLTFRYDQNVFTIEFAALNFIKSSKNKYAYKLEGFDKDWNYVDVPAASYSNLPAGNYRLMVTAANNDGIWNNQAAIIHIKILPAPWKTAWAYLLYLTISVIIIIYIRRFLKARLKLRQELFKERIEAEHQKKSYQQQLDFFTNISHEIRTPLTLILGPIEKLANSKMDSHHVDQYINSIKNNTNRLYRLVTELLDFRKSSSQKLKLYICEEDIVKFLKDIFYSFQSTAEIRGIHFQFHSNTETLPLYYDRDQLEKVFSNLFINAIKFNQPGGTVHISIIKNQPKQEVTISVEDDGKGIRSNELDDIFENFYQSSSSIGSGIGLALTKKLVELHKGTITVSSKPSDAISKGLTSFQVTFKMGREHLTNEHFIFKDAPENAHDVVYVDTVLQNTIPAENGTHPQIKQHTILLVEDNDEVRGFVSQLLEYEYQIIECKNGEEGLKTALETIPDLIISDIMMPVMDGLELCAKIKTDLRTCHIPVILLTAKSAPAHVVHGLQHGADAYITKPFSSQILHLNIHNMLARISAMQKKYNDQMRLEPLQKTSTTSDDEKLLEKLQEIIQQNIGNSDFDLQDLTKEIGMSKSVLYKKFSALTNQSLNNFIKSERLKKAVQLFEEGDTSVMSVAIKVGFNDVKYFSKEFKKVYNITPHKFINP